MRRPVVNVASQAAAIRGGSDRDPPSLSTPSMQNTGRCRRYSHSDMGPMPTSGGFPGTRSIRKDTRTMAQNIRAVPNLKYAV